jgi:hypothetical protein
LAADPVEELGCGIGELRTCRRFVWAESGNRSNGGGCVVDFAAVGEVIPDVAPYPA